MQVIKSIDIAAKTGVAIAVEQGQHIRLTDVDGQQVADVFACSSVDKNNYLSPGHTRTRTGRLFPKLGQCFYTPRYQPILRFEQDHSPGKHDMFYPSCDAHMYRWLKANPDHPNCQSNFIHAAKQQGWQPATMPDPVNIFQNTPATDAGELLIAPALSQAGDYVDFTAMMDLILVVTACAQDLAPINGERCTGLRIDISKDSQEY